MKFECEYGEYAVYSEEVAAVVVKGRKVIKKFKGESAWSEAERYASDQFFKEQYAA